VPDRPARLAAVTADVVYAGDAAEPRDIGTAIAEGREAVEEFTRGRAA